MTLKSIDVDMSLYPEEFHALMRNAKLYDYSFSAAARVILIDKDGGYFLKSAPKGKLEQQAKMTRYFHSKGLTAEMLAYLSDEQDWLLTEKVRGDNGISKKYLEQPKRLCDIFAERLAILHGMDYAGCPVENHTELFLTSAEYGRRNGCFDKEISKEFGYETAEQAWDVVCKHIHLLRNDTLLHGDYCLPNIMLDNWRFSGFVDLDTAGVGDRHVDLFWGTWTLCYNLKTHQYYDRFLDAYGRSRVDEDMLRIIAAAEVFG